MVLTGEESSLPKQTYEVQKGSPITQMCRYQCKESGITKNQVNMMPPKEMNKSLITELKEIEIYELPNNSE